MARKTAATNEQALDAFIAAKTEIDRLLAKLATLRADHFHADPEGINWGQIGTATCDGPFTDLKGSIGSRRPPLLNPLSCW